MVKAIQYSKDSGLILNSNAPFFRNSSSHSLRHSSWTLTSASLAEILLPDSSIPLAFDCNHKARQLVKKLYFYLKVKKGLPGQKPWQPTGIASESWLQSFLSAMNKADLFDECLLTYWNKNTAESCKSERVSLREFPAWNHTSSSSPFFEEKGIKEVAFILMIISHWYMTLLYSLYCDIGW